tara:strand:+ start:408 stop:692 length:285 start_codon:yes stop_codon:yes gene_type:complete
MKQFENYDDDNLAQIGDSIYVHTGHLDTTINDKHIVSDTFVSHDTIYVETHTFDKEIQIIEKIMDRPDFGKSAVSVFILLFVLYSIWNKWNTKK